MNIKYVVPFISLFFLLIFSSPSLPQTEPYPLTPRDVGVMWGDGELRWNPLTGKIATQVERMVKIDYRCYVQLPYMFKELKEILPDGFIPRSLRTEYETTIGELVVENATIALRRGGAYIFGNQDYGWTHCGNMLEDGQKILLSNRPAVLEYFTNHPSSPLFDLLDVEIVDGKVEKKNSEHIPYADLPELKRARLGVIDNGVERTPLTERQQELLHQSHMFHQQFTQGICNGASQEELGNIGRQKGLVHLELESSARNWEERGVLTLIPFAVDIDWSRPKEDVCRLFQLADTFHEKWMEGVLELNMGKAWEAFHAHAITHVFIGYNDPSLELRTICDLPIGDCPDIAY